MAACARVASVALYKPVRNIMDRLMGGGFEYVGWLTLSSTRGWDVDVFVEKAI